MKYYAIKSGKLNTIIKGSFVIVLFCFSFFSYAQITSIPDPQFEQYLIDDGIDSDGIINGQVLNSDIFFQPILNIIGYNISNFEGLQFFLSLTDFTLINNQAATISILDFSNNLLLTDISIINTPNLQQVGIDENINLINLTVVTRGELFNFIDISANINLLSLELADNALLNIDLTNNINLTSLGVAINPMLAVDVSNLTELQNLSTYESQINILDVSSNPKLISLNSDNGALTAVNLKNGFNNILTSVELNGNPNLSCIIVDNVANAEAATSWIKDITATYIDNSTPTIDFEAQDVTLQYDSDNLNQTEIDNWIAQNGGATATSDCGAITWSYDYYVSDGNGDVIYYFDFFATDVFGNSVTTSSTFTLENAGPFNEEVYGSGATICVDIFDLNTVITDIDPTADLNNPNIDFSLSRVSSGEFNEGPLGESFSGTIVDFPDTGAGSYSYLFRVNVESFLTVYKPDTGGFSTIGVLDNANITLNDKTVAFEIQPLSDLEICEGVISSLQDLTDMLIISPDPDIFPPQNPIDLNQYWDQPNYDGSNTYTFNPTAAFPNCPSNAVSITITETQEFFAGDDVLDAQDDSFYSCGDTVSFNLNSFLDVSADSGGEWRDSNNILISNGIVDFPDTGAGQFTKSFSYRQENNDCGFFSEANYDITYDAAELSVGTSSSITVCEGTSVTEQELINELGADDGGFWDVSIDIDNVGAGTFIYSHGDCSSSGDATITVIEELQLFAGDDVLDAQDDNFYSCGDTVSFNLNTFLDATADSGGEWRDSNNILISNGIVDFPDTGAGSFTKTYKYRQGNDTCGFGEANYGVSYDVVGFSVGSDTSLIICEGTLVSEQDLIDELGADDGGFWDVSIDINNVGTGFFTYSHGDCSTEGDSTIEVIEETPLSAGENGTLEIPEGETVTATQLFDALEGNPNISGSWSPMLAGANTYTYTQNTTTSCPESFATVVVTESALSIVDNEFNNISIYPNPTISKINIKGNISQLTSIQIYTISGQLLLELEDNFNEIDITHFDAAIYFMKLNNESKSKIIKLIKK